MFATSTVVFPSAIGQLRFRPHIASCGVEVERQTSNLVAHCKRFGAFLARIRRMTRNNKRTSRWRMVPMELRRASRVLEGEFTNPEAYVAKKTKKKIVRREYSKADVKELRAHSKARTPVDKIMKLTKRTEGSLRQKALKLGIGLGHRR
jgi:hypothetical protein